MCQFILQKIANYGISFQEFHFEIHLQIRILTLSHLLSDSIVVFHPGVAAQNIPPLEHTRTVSSGLAQNIPLDILPIRVVWTDFSQIIVNATLLGCVPVYFTALFELRRQIFVGLAIFPSQECFDGVSHCRDNLRVFVSGKL